MFALQLFSSAVLPETPKPWNRTNTNEKSLQLNLLFFTRPTGENTEGLISVPAGMHVSGSNIGVGESLPVRLL
jgi:hypothetical protein